MFAKVSPSDNRGCWWRAAGERHRLGHGPGASRPTWRLVLVGLVLAETLVMLPYDRIPENKLTTTVAPAAPHAAMAAIRDNRALREQIDRLCPSRIICAGEFKETAPNRRTVDYDFRQSGGIGEPVFLTTLTAKRRAGTRLVWLGKSFALWQAVDPGDCDSPLGVWRHPLQRPEVL
jgi:hypothetical protein